MSVITEFFESDNIVFVVRLLIACFCGFIVGVERSKRQKDAGIRTHIIVALGSALMMIISKYGFFDVAEQMSGMRAVDGSRMAAQIVSGVGFLGAGMIFINHKQSIKGLTTAAGVWATAGIGMAVGAGLYFLGIASALLMLLLQLLLHAVFNIDNAESTEVVVCFDDDIQDVKDFLDMVASQEIDYSNIRISRNSDGNLRLNFFAKTQNGNYDKLFKLVYENDKVKTFSV